MMNHLRSKMLLNLLQQPLTGWWLLGSPCLHPLPAAEKPHSGTVVRFCLSGCLIVFPFVLFCQFLSYHLKPTRVNSLKMNTMLGLVYTSDGRDGSGVISGVGIRRKFWSSVNRHDRSGIVSLAFRVSLAFICKHSRWRTRDMTRDCCFFYCFLFSYDEEDVCNGTRHNTMVINTQTEKTEKTAAIQQHDPD